MFNTRTWETDRAEFNISLDSITSCWPTQHSINYNNTTEGLSGKVPEDSLCKQM